MIDDIILNKIAIIRRCVKRILEEYCGHENEIEFNYTKQDSIVLNLQRAFNASTDLGTRIIRIGKMDIPHKTRDVFVILEKNRVITPKINLQMEAMEGFRNLAVHDCHKLDLSIVHSILQNHLNDFEEYIQAILASQKGQGT